MFVNFADMLFTNMVIHSKIDYSFNKNNNIKTSPYSLILQKSTRYLIC